MHILSYKNFNQFSKKIQLQTPFNTGGINRGHHNNGKPVNIFEITSYTNLVPNGTLVYYFPPSKFFSTSNGARHVRNTLDPDLEQIMHALVARFVHNYHIQEPHVIIAAVTYMFFDLSIPSPPPPSITMMFLNIHRFQSFLVSYFRASICSLVVLCQDLISSSELVPCTPPLYFTLLGCFLLC